MGHGQWPDYHLSARLNLPGLYILDPHANRYSPYKHHYGDSYRYDHLNANQHRDSLNRNAYPHANRHEHGNTHQNGDAANRNAHERP